MSDLQESFLAKGVVFPAIEDKAWVLTGFEPLEPPVESPLKKQALMSESDAATPSPAPSPAPSRAPMAKAKAKADDNQGVAAALRRRLPEKRTEKR